MCHLMCNKEVTDMNGGACRDGSIMPDSGTIVSLRLWVPTIESRRSTTVVFDTHHPLVGGALVGYQEMNHVGI